jgi:hypothetical protein
MPCSPPPCRFTSYHHMGGVQSMNTCAHLIIHATNHPPSLPVENESSTLSEARRRLLLYLYRHLRYETPSKHGVATRQSLADRACDLLPEKLLPSRIPTDKRLELGSRVGAECPWRLAHATTYHSCPLFAKFDMPPPVSPASPNPVVMSTVGSAGALGTIMSICVGQQPTDIC